MKSHLALLKSVNYDAGTGSAAMDLQVKLTQFRPRFLALLADHREAQMFEILSDPHPSLGTVVVDALDLDLYLAANLLASASAVATSPNRRKAMDDAVSLLESAVHRTHTYVYSTARAIGLA